MEIEVTALTPAIGANVSGIDLKLPLDDTLFGRLRSLLAEHQVLFFRDQSLEPEQHIALARRFGGIDEHAFGPHLPGMPEIIRLDQTDPENDGANRWHTDSTFRDQPPMAGILCAVQLPGVGSDTCWASMSAAYDRLSPMLQRTFEGLTATHDIVGPLQRAASRGQSIGNVDQIRAANPPRSHPMVCRHPETGRKFLFANSNFTTRVDGVTEAESDALLGFLFEWVKTPEIQVRFRWEVGSVAIWDNPCTQHYAVADYRERRVMNRVSVAGEWTPAA